MKWLCIVAVALWGVTMGFSQIRSGTIVGLVTDNSNAAIPGAKVEVKNISTNVSVRAETNAVG